MKIFELFGDIKLNGAEDAEKKMGSLDSKGSKLGAVLGGVGKVAIGLGTAVAAGAASIGAMAGKAAETTDRIDKLSQKLGLSRTGFQEWDFITSQSGTSVESLTAGMKTLTNQFDELEKGGKVATDAFDALGIKYEDLQGMTQEEIFETTIAALQGVEDVAKRAAIANDLLGRSGQELAPLLNAGADSIEAMKQQAHELGLVMGDDAIDAGVKFTDTMDQLKRSFGTVFATIGVELMPIMQSFAEWIIANMPTIQTVVGNVFDVISKVVTTAVDVFNTYLLPIFTELYDWIAENMPQIQGTAQTVFEAIQKHIENVVVAISKLIAWGKQWYEDNKETLDSIYDSFVSILTTIVNFITNFISQVKLFWDLFGDDIMKATAIVWDMIATIIDGALKVISGVMDFFIGVLTGDWELMSQGLKKIWDGLWSTITTIVGGAWERMSTAFSNLWTDIETWFVNLVNDGIQWGKDLIEGLVKGITEMAMKPVNAIKDMAEGISKGFKDFFGIQSPSKLMAEDGDHLMTGLAKGITDNKDKPLNALQAVADGIANIMSKTAQRTSDAVRYTSRGNTGRAAYSNYVAAVGGTSSAYAGSQAEYEAERDKAAREIAIREGVDLSVGRSMADQKMTEFAQVININVKSATEAIKEVDYYSTKLAEVY